MASLSNPVRTEVPRPRAEQHSPESIPVTRLVSGTLAVLRLATGFVFLWAFLDKTFGFGYATPDARAWIEGGSPTKGFLSNVDVGPFADTFQSWAGDTWADWLFMVGLLGIGVALIAGVAMRIAAVSGSLMMLLMWAAEWPLDKTLSDGSPSMSPNPLIDYHILYALVLVTLAVLGAGAYYGFGRQWDRITGHNPWLR